MASCGRRRKEREKRAATTKGELSGRRGKGGEDRHHQRIHWGEKGKRGKRGLVFDRARGNGVYLNSRRHGDEGGKKKRREGGEGPASGLLWEKKKREREGKRASQRLTCAGSGKRSRASALASSNYLLKKEGGGELVVLFPVTEKGKKKRRCCRCVSRQRPLKTAARGKGKKRRRRKGSLRFLDGSRNEEERKEKDRLAMKSDQSRARWSPIAKKKGERPQ